MMQEKIFTEGVSLFLLVGGYGSAGGIVILYEGNLETAKNC